MRVFLHFDCEPLCCVFQKVERRACTTFLIEFLRLRLPLHRRAAGRVLLRIYHRRSGRHVQAGKTHDSCIYSSLFAVNAPGRAPGCFAGLLRWAAALRTPPR